MSKLTRLRSSWPPGEIAVTVRRGGNEESVLRLSLRARKVVVGIRLRVLEEVLAEDEHIPLEARILLVNKRFVALHFQPRHSQKRRPKQLWKMDL